MRRKGPSRQAVEKARLRRSFPMGIAPFAYSPTARRAANGVRKPCYARLPAPPHMSLGPDYTWRAAALQTSHGVVYRQYGVGRGLYFAKERPLPRSCKKTGRGYLIAVGVSPPG